jgi:hypothetical protein
MPSLVHEKVEELYQFVSGSCVASLDARSRAGMVLDAQGLQKCMRDAFLVLAESLDASFDLGKALSETRGMSTIGAWWERKSHSYRAALYSGTR